MSDTPQLDFMKAESICFFVGGRESRESTDGALCSQRPPSVGENLFEICFGFWFNEIKSDRLVLVVVFDYHVGVSMRGIRCENVGKL